MEFGDLWEKVMEALAGPDDEAFMDLLDSVFEKLENTEQQEDETE